MSRIKLLSPSNYFLDTYRHIAYTGIRMMSAKQLQEWRRRNNYSQGKLSVVLGVDVMTVSRWERKITTIPPFLALALECLEKKGDEKKIKGMEKKTERKVKKHGLHLQAKV